LTLTEASLSAITIPGVGKSDEVYALINNLKLGANVRGLRVFVNHPDLSIDTPNTDPHFVSTIAFLDHSGHNGDNAGKQLPSAIVRLTPTLKKLHGLERLKIGEISVQLIPIPVEGVIMDKVEGVSPGSVEIVIL
jgi:tyrosinase